MKYQTKSNRTVIEVFKFGHEINIRGNGNQLIVLQTKIEAGRKAFSVQGALLFNKSLKSDRELSISFD